jgi:hypothetical protein
MMVFLRLLSIYSQVNGGIKPKVLEEFQRDFLQVSFQSVSFQYVAH